MSHYVDFDPYLSRERNEQIRAEVDSLRLEKQLRKRRHLQPVQIAALGEWGRILIGRAKLTQVPLPRGDGGSSGLCGVESAGIRGCTQNVRR